MELLVIEDDPLIGRSLQKGLEEARHQCTWVKDGRRGRELALSQQFDAVLLDLLLPGESGLNVLRELRDIGVRTPILILTALGSVEERVAGLKAGADDYVVKPFALVELLARLEAVCRRTTDKPAPLMRVGELSLDLTTRRVTRAGVEIDLTPTEFSLLELLMRYAGQVVTRRMLCEHLWEEDWEGETNVIEVHINRLRNKLQRGFTDSQIETVRGRGYVVRAL
jgi:two-component system OmpR family response regulator/two-component system copper resistance phosphate regulon response regulator CusR